MTIMYPGGFLGERPLLDPRLLPEKSAQVSRNIYRRRGTLKPERKPAHVSDVPQVFRPANLFRYTPGDGAASFWLSWRRGLDVDVARSPIANDQYERVYWTGDGPPKMGGIDVITQGDGPYPSSWYQLGVPAPEQAPEVREPNNRTPPDDGSVDWPPATVVETAYVVTCVSNYGEESAPSMPSSLIERWDDESDVPSGGHVIVTLPPMPSSSNNIQSMRIYRTESGGMYQYVADVAAGTGTFEDDVSSAELGIALPSAEWDMPDPKMKGLTTLPNGILAGFFGNTVAFCEAYYPHAWPVSYQLAFDDPVVGLASTSAGLVVLTTGRPSLVTGSSPAAMSQMKLDVYQSCVSKRSIVEMGGYALYASPDGLIAVGGQQAEVVTKEVFSRDQWKALDPSSIHAYRYDGRYMAFHTNGCMAFTPGEGIDRYDVKAEGGYYDSERDTLYLLQDGAVTAWGAGDLFSIRWRSPITNYPPGRATLTCGRILAHGYPVKLCIYADGETVMDQAITGPDMFRLPAGYTFAREWEVEVAGNNEVVSIQLAGSPGELH
ncbi:hypothetical protein [Halomonas elongata]|uniref:hypothetical protein n=1 Tax=Halomonas elongata TaxID=2746 RepID=UPI00186B7550|nr:hypothetical protein [Halomonas elongata]MBW5800680.1 hypothetical protein [Halomonas elongata]